MIMGEMMKILKIVMMQLIKAVQVRDMTSHQVMMMKKVMIIHLHHQFSSREQVGEIQYLPPNILHINILMTDAGEPSCYEEAVSDKHKNEWSEAI
jgi:hypothetical protein